MGILTLEKTSDSYTPPGPGELTPKQQTLTTPTKKAMDKISLPKASIPDFVRENLPRGYGPMAPSAGDVGPGTSIPHPGGRGGGTGGAAFDPGSFVNAVGAGAQTFDVAVTGSAGNAHTTGSGQNGSSGGGLENSGWFGQDGYGVLMIGGATLGLIALYMMKRKK